MIFIRIAGVEVIAGIFHHNGLFAILTEGKLSKVHDGHNIVVKAGVGMWILGKLRQFRTLHIVPLDLHEALVGPARGPFPCCEASRESQCHNRCNRGLAGSASDSLPDIHKI